MVSIRLTYIVWQLVQLDFGCYLATHYTLGVATIIWLFVNNSYAEYPV